MSESFFYWEELWDYNEACLRPKPNFEVLPSPTLFFFVFSNARPLPTPKDKRKISGVMPPASSITIKCDKVPCLSIPIT